MFREWDLKFVINAVSWNMRERKREKEKESSRIVCLSFCYVRWASSLVLRQRKLLPVFSTWMNLISRNQNRFQINLKPTKNHHLPHRENNKPKKNVTWPPKISDLSNEEDNNKARNEHANRGWAAQSARLCVCAFSFNETQQQQKRKKTQKPMLSLMNIGRTVGHEEGRSGLRVGQVSRRDQVRLGWMTDYWQVVLCVCTTMMTRTRVVGVELPFSFSLFEWCGGSVWVWSHWDWMSDLDGGLMEVETSKWFDYFGRHDSIQWEQSDEI